MKKIFSFTSAFSFLFCFALFSFTFPLSTFAQDKVPTVTLENNITTTIGTEVRLNRIEIEISDNGLKASKIKLFGGIGKTSNSVDPDTGLFLYETYQTQLIYDGRIGDLLILVNSTVGQEQATAFASSFISIFYDKVTNTGLVKQFNDLLTLLIAGQKITIDPSVKTLKP